MKKIFLTFFIIIIFISNFSFSQWVWQNPYNIPNNINVIKFINSNTGWCFCNYAKNYKTTNGGNNWVPYLFDSTYETSYAAVYKFDSLNTTIWLGTTAGILVKSTNSGINWSYKTIPNPNSITHIYFLNSNTGYVTAKYLLKTTNGGNNWVFSDSASYLYDIYSSYFINNNTGWEIAYKYVFIPPPTTDLYINRTTNAGNNWVNTFHFNNSNNFYTPPLNIIFKDSLNGLINFNNNVYQTTNSGVNWTNVYGIGNFEFINNNTGFVAGNNGFAKTTNFGFNWIAKNYYPDFNPNCINVLDTSNIFIGGNNGVLVKTSNSGFNWSLFQNSVSSKNIKNITAVDTLNLFCFAPDNVIIKTTNGGYNWSCLDTNLFAGNIIISSFFLNSNTWWFGTNNKKILKTSNSGTSWLVSNLNVNIKEIKIFDSGIGYAISDSCIFKTTNSGINWTNIYQIFGNRFLINFNFPNTITGYCIIREEYSTATYYKILNTIDGGSNWSYIYTYSNLPNFISFINENTGYSDGNEIHGFQGNFYTYHILYKTTNSGLNWNSVLNYTENIASNELYESIICTNNNCVYLVDKIGGFWASTNGGTTWQNTNLTNTRFNSITSFGKNIWVAGDYGKLLKCNNIIPSTIRNINSDVPKDYLLYQNFPNPFNLSTNIRYQITKNSFINLKVFDILGKEIQSMVNDKQKPGTYEVNFIGSNLASGIYYYSLFADGVRMDTKRMALIK